MKLQLVIVFILCFLSGYANTGAINRTSDNEVSDLNLLRLEMADGHIFSEFLDEIWFGCVLENFSTFPMKFTLPPKHFHPTYKEFGQNSDIFCTNLIFIGNILKLPETHPNPNSSRNWKTIFFCPSAISNCD